MMVSKEVMYQMLEVCQALTVCRIQANVKVWERQAVVST